MEKSCTEKLVGIQWASLNLQNYIDLGTSISLNIPVFKFNDKFKIYKNISAYLYINENDKSNISFEEYKDILDYKDDNYSSIEDLIISLNFSNNSILELLDAIGCYEIADFRINDINDIGVIYVLNNKLIVVNDQKDDFGNGWEEIGKNTYCLLPLAKYIILGSIEDGPIRIIMYG